MMLQIGCLIILTELLKLNVIETTTVKDKTCQGYVNIKNDKQFVNDLEYIPVCRNCYNELNKNKA